MKIPGITVHSYTGFTFQINKSPGVLNGVDSQVSVAQYCCKKIDEPILCGYTAQPNLILILTHNMYQISRGKKSGFIEDTVIYAQIRLFYHSFQY